MTGLGQDLRFALRGLRRNPGFTAVAVITLALGIGANSAIFSVVNGVLLRPLPYHDPQRIVTVLHTDKGWPVAPANFLDWRAQNHAFEALGAAQAWGATLRAAGGQPLAVKGVEVSGDLFRVLGVPPLRGRTLAEGDTQAGAAPAVVLTHRLWSSRFGGDPALLGQTIDLGGVGHQVVGIMPQSFEFPPFWVRNADLFVPLSLGARQGDRSGQSLRVFGRLAPGTTLAAAQAEMDGIWKRLAALYPDDNAGIDVQLQVLHEKVVGQVRGPLLVLLGGVTFVLLIACANLANLLLARAAGRRREIAVRASLGAGRGRVIRQLLTESLVLAVLGGALGIALCHWAVDLLVALGPPSLPRRTTITVDGWVLGFTAAVSLATGVAFGVAPALQLSRRDLGSDLRRQGRGTTEGAGGNRLRGALVVSQVALALVLLAGAGLMWRSLQRLQAVEAGFDARGLLSVVMPLPVPTDPAVRAERARVVYQGILERVRAQPGVANVSVTNHLPLGGDIWGREFSVEGERVPVRRSATYRLAAPGYFRTMGMTLVKGREFSPDEGPLAPGAVIVNQAFAAAVWPGQDPLGERIRVEDGGPNPRQVIGVVKDVRQREWKSTPGPEMYLGYLQTPPPRYLTLVVRAQGEAAPLAARLREELWALDRSQPPPAVIGMEEVVADALGEPRFNLTLLNLFAAVALLLAAVGLYGVMAYLVSRRTVEIGIRLALGAQAGDVRKLVVGRGMGLALLGLVLGLVAALFTTHTMEAMLYGVTATDPLTFAFISAVLMAVTLLACYLPARRAMRVDPMFALRAE